MRRSAKEIQPPVDQFPITAEGYPALLQGEAAHSTNAAPSVRFRQWRTCPSILWRIGREILVRSSKARLRKSSTDANDKQIFQMKGAESRGMRAFRRLTNHFVAGAACGLVVDRSGRRAGGVEHGWSGRTQHKRSGAAITTNFDGTLPLPDSPMLAPGDHKGSLYIRLPPCSGDDVQERELEERRLLGRKSSCWVGVGFAFVGSQYRLDVGGSDFFVTCSSITSSFAALLSSI